MFNIGDISLGQRDKRYSHNLGFDNNTTMPFGVVQPLMSQFIEPKNSISVSAKQLVRLAPMPCPSFARMSLLNKAVYVPISDVCPYYEALMSNIAYKGASVSYVPKEVPYVSNRLLVNWLLTRFSGSTPVDMCVFSVYKPKDGNENLLELQEYSSDIRILVNNYFKSMAVGSYYPIFMEVQYGYGDGTVASSGTSRNYNEFVSIDGADMVFTITDSNGKVSALVAIRLGFMARMMRSNLIGLGYSLDYSDTTHISALPIFAYIKAYFETFKSRRDLSWTDTSCYFIIKYIEEQYAPGYFFSVDNANQDFAAFLDELATWYVAPDDFFSVQTTSYTTLPHTTECMDNTLGTENGNPILTSDMPNTPAKGQPELNGLDGINYLGLQMLQRLTRFVNKDSVIGQRISTWMRQHFDSSVANSLYESVYQIAQSKLPLQVNDVFSTADTAQEVNDVKSGEHLGSYAGKGLGFGDFHFKFDAPYHGFVFVLGCIVPKSGYFQGTDPTLYALSRYDFPHREFDGLGYELTPKGCLANHNDIQFGKTSLSGESFGYIPRYSGFKVKKNIVNGDMSRRGIIDDYSPYYLDRFFRQNGVQVVEALSDGTEFNHQYRVHYYANELPNASQEYRELCRYPNFGNYDRLFYNSGNLDKGSSGNDMRDNIDDNFIVQSIFDVKLKNFLKPIEMSYDTYDEDVDNTTKDVSPE